MKKLSLLLMFLIGVSGFSQSKQSSILEAKGIGILQFESELIDYGSIKQNENGERFFVFTNIGEEPVTISKVKSSCGCTVATQPRKPILPGETAKIGIKYDTKRLGRFSKSIRVSSNAENNLVSLRISGNVVANN